MAICLTGWWHIVIDLIPLKLFPMSSPTTFVSLGCGHYHQLLWYLWNTWTSNPQWRSNTIIHLPLTWFSPLLITGHFGMAQLKGRYFIRTYSFLILCSLRCLWTPLEHLTSDVDRWGMSQMRTLTSDIFALPPSEEGQSCDKKWIQGFFVLSKGSYLPFQDNWEGWLLRLVCQLTASLWSPLNLVLFSFSSQPVDGCFSSRQHIQAQGRMEARNGRAIFPFIQREKPS